MSVWNPSGCVSLMGAILSVDKRGKRRPFGASCDIGEVELLASAPARPKERVVRH